MAENKKDFCPCIGNPTNHFSGVLPCHHNEAGCHRQSSKKKAVLGEMKKILNDLNVPPCNEWDTSTTYGNTSGPYKFGEYDRSQGKPWDLGRVSSRELIGSIMIPTCMCMKRNGLQDECLRLQCRGRPWCLTDPWPSCPPFTKVPQETVDPNRLLMCPNYPKS